MTKIPFLLLDDDAFYEFNLCRIDNSLNETSLYFYNLRKGGDPYWQGDASLLCRIVIHNQSQAERIVHFLQSEDFVLWERLNSYDMGGDFKWWVKRECESPEMSSSQHEEWRQQNAP